MIQFPNNSLVYNLQNTESMVKAQTLMLIVIAILVIQSSAIMFKLVSNEATCLTFAGGKTYVFEYVVSGQQNKNVKMEIYDNDQFMTRKQNADDYQSTFKFSSGFGKVCFSRTDGKQKSISFDFYEEADPVRQIIDKKDISYTVSSLNKAVNTLKQVGRNQKFHIQRNQINRSNLEESQSKIKWAGIIKIFFLITSALIQLWIMKSFFNRNSVPYQPVDQS